MQASSLAAEILAGLIVLALPLLGPLERRLYRRNLQTPLKLSVYGVTMALLWGLAIAAIRLDGLAELMGCPARAWLWAPAISSLALSLGVTAYMTTAFLPLVQSLRGSRWRLAYEAAIRRNFAEIPGLLPDKGTERGAWVLLSLSAGICEEVIFRGFMIRSLSGIGGGMPLFAALVASAAIFGLAHLYQGLKGVLGTAVGGLALGALYLLTGSLIPSIILHVLLDLQMIYIVRAAAPDQTPRSPRLNM